MKKTMGDMFIEWAESQGYEFVDCEVADIKGNPKIIRTLKVKPTLQKDKLKK